MAKAKLQRRFVRGAEYVVEGRALRKRRLQFVGQFKGMDGREALVFVPRRQVKKSSQP